MRFPVPRRAPACEYPESIEKCIWPLRARRPRPPRDRARTTWVGGGPRGLSGGRHYTLRQKTCRGKNRPRPEHRAPAPRPRPDAINAIPPRPRRGPARTPSMRSAHPHASSTAGRRRDLPRALGHERPDGGLPRLRQEAGVRLHGHGVDAVAGRGVREPHASTSDVGRGHDNRRRESTQYIRSGRGVLLLLAHGRRLARERWRWISTSFTPSTRRPAQEPCLACELGTRGSTF